MIFNSGHPESQNNSTTLFQAGQDWQLKPFVEVKYLERGDCEPGWESIFTYKYLGSVEGCLVRRYLFLEATGLAEPKVMTQEEYLYNFSADEDYECTYIPAIPPKNTTKFEEGTFCGKRGGKSFIDVTRPDLETKLCPEGTKPCSSKTTIDNTVCYPEADIDSSCPITDFKFVASSEKKTYSDRGYTTIELSGGPKDQNLFVYSKTATDNLPIT